MHIVEPQEIREYVKLDGENPFREWLHSLKDLKARAQILVRLDRVLLGNFGDCGSVGGGVHEFRINLGPGYRIYFAKAGKAIVLLLCGGDKSSQSKDVKIAKEYWQDYKRRILS
jgi:putative addiction module killer protein